MSRYNSQAAAASKSNTIAASSKSSKAGNFLARKSSLTRSSSKELAIDVMPSDKAKSVAKTPLTTLLSRNNQQPNANLTLITVTVLGSPGPLRFMIDKNDKVSRVLEGALKAYAREGRLPLLNNKSVELYCNNGDFKALDPSECVSDLGTRQFLLYRKKPEENTDFVSSTSNTSSGPFKHWWNLMSSIVCSH